MNVNKNLGKTCLPELGGGQFYLENEKRMNKIKHEGIGICPRIEISEDADNADRKVKWNTHVVSTYIAQ